MNDPQVCSIRSPLFEDRLQLIDSIDKLIKSDWDRKSKERI